MHVQHRLLFMKSAASYLKTAAKCALMAFLDMRGACMLVVFFCLQALNAMKMREVLAEAPGLASERLVIPQPVLELTTRYWLDAHPTTMHTPLISLQRPCHHSHNIACFVRILQPLALLAQS